MSLISSSLQYERGLLAHHAACASDVCQIVTAKLAVERPALDLPGRLDHVRHAARHAGLPEAQLAAMRVAGKVTLIGKIVFAHECHPLPRATKSRVLDGEKGGDRVAVVKLHHVD